MSVGDLSRLWKKNDFFFSDWASGRGGQSRYDTAGKVQAMSGVTTSRMYHRRSWNYEVEFVFMHFVVDTE